jgi:Na+-driven multidrug efflux pump
MGVTAIVARRIGEQRREEAAVTAVQAILVALSLSLPFRGRRHRVRAGPAADHGRRRVDASSTATATCGGLLGGNAVIMLLFTINAIFRGAGDAAVAMRVLWSRTASTSCSTRS